MLLCGVVLPRFDARWTHAFGRASLGLGLCLLTACNYPKPPASWSGAQPVVVVAAPPPPAPPPPPPPPPPPKCEDLAEGCSASAETKLAVGDVAWFLPPEGWHYAKSPNGSVAVHPNGTALIVLLPSSDPHDLAPMIEALATERGVKGLNGDKLRRRLKKPQQSLPAGDGTVALWEVDESQQGEALSLTDQGQGTLLVLIGKLRPDRHVVGIAFVVQAAAETEAPKIMQAVQTLRGAP